MRVLHLSNVNASLKTNLDILNKELTRQSLLTELSVNFSFGEEDGSKGTQTAIKFPKYMKKLTHLELRNVWHKDFTDTLFDMANQRLMKKLCLSFVAGVPLDGFTEALRNFYNLRHFELENIEIKKLNYEHFFEWAEQLTHLSFTRVDLSNPCVSLMLVPTASLRTLRLSNLTVDLTHLNDLLATSVLYRVELDQLPGIFHFSAYQHIKVLSLSQMKLIGQDTEVCGLKSVTLHRCSFDLKTLIAILQSCQALKALEI